MKTTNSKTTNKNGRGQSQKKTDIRNVIKHPDQINPAVGAVIGAISGAVVGTIVVRVLASKDYREKAKVWLDKSIDALKEMNENPHGVETFTDRALDEAKNTTRKFLHDENEKEEYTL